MKTNQGTEEKEKRAGNLLAEAMLRYEQGTISYDRFAKLARPAVTQYPNVAKFAMDAYEKRESQTLTDAFCKRRNDLQKKIENRALTREEFETEVLSALENPCCQNGNEQKYLWEIWQEHKKTPYTEKSPHINKKATKPYVAMNAFEKLWDNIKFLPYSI